ncbi:MAG TPA: chromate transporter [Bdellovibrionales bacterium]|nr:chromate transporter [Bdellovibrionales bacterium]
MRGLDWFWLNLKVGALSFGGAGRIFLYHEGVVEKHEWLSEDEYAEIFTIVQVLPGPNLVNLAVYLGYRLAGPWWSIAGLLALATPGVFFALAVIAIVDLQNFHVASLFQGFSLGSIALFAAFLFKLAKGLRQERTGAAKLALRIAIIAGIATAVFMSAPLFWILTAGIPACLAVEFLT